MLPFLRTYIPGLADSSTYLKTAIVGESVVVKVNGKQRTTKSPKGFVWTESHTKVFEEIKEVVLENSCSGGNENLQWHLSTDASKTGAGGVLFQISDSSEGTVMAKEHIQAMRIVMFLSFQFTPTQLACYGTRGARSGLRRGRGTQRCWSDNLLAAFISTIFVQRERRPWKSEARTEDSLSLTALSFILDD